MKENIVLFREKKDCCGCGACKNICQKNAISMHNDEYGFSYPIIDNEKCINCGMCKKVCAYQNIDETTQPQKAYAAQSKEEKIISSSASGGVFSAIASMILLDNGVVFGCAMENNSDGINPVHIKVESIEDLKKLQGSKYVQSVTGNIYRQVKAELSSNRPVLFSGTPCQVAALKSFLGNKYYDNLFTIDIICHGVPSTEMFKSYIEYYEKKLNGKITEFKFRDKSKGWGLTGGVNYVTNNGKIKTKYIPKNLSSYTVLFLKSYIYRENCYSCKYASANRPGDITIGDYWGIEKEHPEYLKKNGGCFDEEKGISCLIINNNQGEKLISKYGETLDLKKSEFDNIARWNGQLNSPCEMSDKREEILKLYRSKGYSAVEKWYYMQIGLKKYVYQLYYRLPDCIRKLLRK